MSDGMRRELMYLSSYATNRYFIPNWGINIHLSFVIVGIYVLMIVFHQFYLSATGVAKGHKGGQNIVFYLFAIISVNATFGAYPHCPIFGFNNAAHPSA